MSQEAASSQQSPMYEAETEKRIYKNDNVSYQTTCKYTIVNQKQIQRLVKIRDEALMKQQNPNDPLHFNPKDLEFVGMLCSDGTLDLSKRGVTVRGRNDGILVAYDLEKNGIATNPKEFAIQSVIHLVPYNEKIANIFHFQIPIPTHHAKGNIKSILDRECPKWQQYRSRQRETVHKFLSNKINGRSAFIKSRKSFNHAEQSWNNDGQEVECIAFEANAEDVNSVIDTLQKQDVVEYFNNNDQVIHISKVKRQLCTGEEESVNDDKTWLKLDFQQKQIHRNLLASVGLYTVILNQQKNDAESKGVYLHGVRRFASQICQGVVNLEPKSDFPQPLKGLYHNEEDAIDVIRCMRLVTGRSFSEGSKFAETAKMFDITYQPSSNTTKKQMYSAHTRFNGNLVLRGIEESIIGRFQSAGFAREEMVDMYLAATAALKMKTEKGLEGVAVLNSIGNNEFSDKTLEKAGVEDRNIKDDPLVVEHKGMLAVVNKEGENVVFADMEGKIFAVYCKRQLIDPDQRPVYLGGLPEGCVKDASKSNHVANALARLCFICAACRHCERLMPYERTLRALWLYTECERPEFNKNVHDLSWLSICAKESSNSFHWSVLPYA